MRYREFGRTGIMVSELCLGTMTFGGGATIGGLDQKGATEMVAYALDKGVNFIDTADRYSGGESETLVGKALGSRRQDVFLATKGRFSTGAQPLHNGLSRGHIIKAVDDSLRRLGTDYIDLYQLHIPDAHTPLDETLRALDDLVRWGKLRYVGCCNFPAWQLMKSLAISDQHDWSRMVSLQAHYTVIERSLERELVPLIKDQGLGLMIWSPLTGGFLAGKYTREGGGPEGSRRTRYAFPPVTRPEQAFDTLDVLREIAAAHEITVARTALAWLLHQDVVSSVIVGARKMSQLADNLEATDVRFSAEELARLQKVSELTPEYPGWMLAQPWDERM